VSGIPDIGDLASLTSATTHAAMSVRPSGSVRGRVFFYESGGGGGPHSIGVAVLTTACTAFERARNASRSISARCSAHVRRTEAADAPIFHRQWLEERLAISTFPIVASPAYIAHSRPRRAIGVVEQEDLVQAVGPDVVGLGLDTSSLDSLKRSSMSDTASPSSLMVAP
jgi:hypothetical protein